MVLPKNILPVRIFIVLTCTALFQVGLYADELAQAGRSIVAKYQDCLVTLQIRIKFHTIVDTEAKNETVGVIIDPSGLIVTSLSTTDPGISNGETSNDSDNMKLKSEILNLTIHTAEGKELPGKIVSFDKDLDLAFIRPLKKPMTLLPALDLGTACMPALFDQIAIISRLGIIANHTVSITLERLQAVVQKPNTLFVPGIAATSARPGSAVFSFDGKPIGILLLHKLPDGITSLNSPTGGIGTSNFIYVILPASYIAESAKMAPEFDKVNDTMLDKDKEFKELGIRGQTTKYS